MEPISQRILLGAAGAGGETYWINRLDFYASGQYGKGTRVDGQGNVYGFWNNLTSGYYAGFYSIDKQGNLRWYNYHPGSDNQYKEWGGCALSNDGLTLYADWSRGADYSNKIAAFDTTTGSLNNIYTLTSDGNNGREATNLIVDNSGNLIVSGSGYDPVNGRDCLHVSRINPSNYSHLFRNFYAPNPDRSSYLGADHDGPDQSAVDPSGNLYFAHGGGTEQSYYSDQMTSLTSTGSVRWKFAYRYLGNGFGGCAYSSSANSVYATSSVDNQAAITKINASNGSWQWTVKAVNWAYSPEMYNCVVDSSGNVYAVAVGTPSGLSGNHLVIIKLTSSGSAVWIRKITINSDPTSHTSSNPSPFTASISLDAKDNMYITYCPGHYSLFTLRLPSDGSLTGDYSLGSNFNNYYLHYVALSMSTASTTPTVDSQGTITRSSSRAYSATSLALTSSNAYTYIIE